MAEPPLDALLAAARRAHQARRLPEERLAPLEATLRAHRRPPARRRLLWAGAALAAGLTAGLAGWWASPRPAAPVDPPAALARSAPAPTALSPISPTVTEPPTLAQAPTQLPGGAWIEPQGGPVQIRSVGQHTHLALRAAGVRSRVPPLPPGGSYRIETPLADVTVKGTEFTVTDQADGATWTSVASGQVRVTPRDGRPERLLGPGDTVTLEPVTRAGAERAEARDDWAQAAWIWPRIPAGDQSDLGRRNQLLQAGKRLEAEAPALAAPYWAELCATFPTGAHAEAFLWHLGAAQHRAGDAAAARAAGARLRAQFPASPYAEQTRRW